MLETFVGFLIVTLNLLAPTPELLGTAPISTSRFSDVFSATVFHVFSEYASSLTSAGVQKDAPKEIPKNVL